jgi:hypothetical protein
MSFRRGSAKQKQVVENLLDLINKTGDEQFGGVLFLYAANDEFRSELIAKYEALENRIGGASLSAGSPMTPFINLDMNDDDTSRLLELMGERLMDVYETATGAVLDRAVQRLNFKTLRQAYTLDLRLSPRAFVALVTRFLPRQAENPHPITDEEARLFVSDNDPDRDVATGGIAP